MIKTSKAAQIETAVRMYVNEARARGGEVPCIKADTYEVARRLIRLEYDSLTSTHRLPAELDTYLEKAGFNPVTVQIEDYDKFDATQAAYDQREASKPKRTRGVGSGVQPTGPLLRSGVARPEPAGGTIKIFG